ncbi:hypothetical protein QQX09_09770 [Demequina sp. SYSU T00192]|uniref:DUF4386 family protein n=1 Tax=Demequina litoralis TaxID=3051660 RepID=A0ABT8GAY4_9MICO|nr:hypothetical protein [Demequina sp. SYSU T00192]MDN4476139.1 hypothetical protein [Demequina sp. SYSU T00192]
MSIHRSAGLALIFYGIATLAAAALAGTPGGDYDETALRGFVGSGHAASLAWAAVGIAGALALLHAVRGLSVGRDAHDPVWGLGIAAVAVGVAGWFIAAGLPVTFLEAGDHVTSAIPLPVVQAIGEIGVLVSLCGPALLMGAVALLVAARRDLPRWVRVAAVVGGLCGITAPLFLTAFVYLLWAVVMGTWMATRAAAVPAGPRRTAPITA